LSEYEQHNKALLGRDTNSDSVSKNPPEKDRLHMVKTTHFMQTHSFIQAMPHLLGMSY